MEGMRHWATTQAADWRRTLDLMRSGKIGTHEGSRDTTQETVEDLSVRLEVLEAIIARHEATLPQDD